MPTNPRESEARSESLLAEALSLYPGLRSPRASRISRGLIHRTWRVEEGGEHYILQQLNPVFSLAVHDNIEAVTARLADRGIETPRLCRTRDGELYADVGDACFRMMTLIEGEASDTCPSPAHAESAGRLVGRFHGALDDLPHEFAPLGFAFHDTDRYFAELGRALEAHREHRMHAEVEAIARRLQEVSSSWTSLAGLPERVVHLDLKFNNILFRENRACCLIDLDTLSRAPLWVELGDAWRSWCNRKREHEAVAEIDVDVFEASAGAWLDTVEFEIGPAEIDSLAHAIERLCIELACRFATDVLEQSYFAWNAELFGSAAEHNLARVRSQLSLHDQARETRGDRLKFLRDRRS